MKNIIIAVLVVLVAGVGYFAFVKKSAPVAYQTPTPTVTTTVIKTTSPTVDPTANWKTYSNQTYGYEVKYPNNWKVSETDSQVNFMPIGGQDVSLSLFVFNKPVSEARLLVPLLNVPGRNVDSQWDIIVNGVDWIQVTVDKNQIAQLTYHNNKTYAVQYSTLEKANSQIFATFKFTK